jgi:hypothetical protein
MKKRKLLKKEANKLKRILIFTIIICVIAVITSSLVQLYGQNKINQQCSYLDPITIDFLAFAAALFLVIEGFARIIEHPAASFKRQFTRIIRIAFGFAIITLHLIQIMHK